MIDREGAGRPRASTNGAVRPRGPPIPGPSPINSMGEGRIRSRFYGPPAVVSPNCQPVAAPRSRRCDNPSPEVGGGVDGRCEERAKRPAGERAPAGRDTPSATLPLPDPLEDQPHTEGTEDSQSSVFLRALRALRVKPVLCQYPEIPDSSAELRLERRSAGELVSGASGFVADQAAVSGGSGCARRARRGRGPPRGSRG
jgi:hypothetical protein